MSRRIVKLDESHIELLKPLFENTRYMGVSLDSVHFTQRELGPDFFEHFCNSYLGSCNNYHAFGVIGADGAIQCFMAFYESIDDASWYGTLVRSAGGDIEALRDCLDALIKYNEENGRFKYYIMVPLRYNKIYRRFLMSEWAKSRYDSVDEFYVKAKEQCKYTLPWQILYSRLLNPVDTVVKCLYLTRDSRKGNIANGGVKV